jgi:hypothetical protein
MSLMSDSAALQAPDVELIPEACVVTTGTVLFPELEGRYDDSFDAVDYVSLIRRLSDEQPLGP